MKRTTFDNFCIWVCIIGLGVWAFTLEARLNKTQAALIKVMDRVQFQSDFKEGMINAKELDIEACRELEVRELSFNCPLEQKAIHELARIVRINIQRSK